MAIEVSFDDKDTLAKLERLLVTPPEEIDLGKGRKMKLATAKKVGQIGGLKVFIFADEHPPPHVCVRFQGESANYQISDGTRLTPGLARHDRHVIPWLIENKQNLIKAWDDSRPTGCTVGKYREVATPE